MGYTLNEQRSRRYPRKGLFISLGIVLLTILIVGVWFIFLRDKAAAPAEQKEEQPIVAETNIESVTAKYLFSGTIVPARAVENEARTASGIDYNQPFSGLNTFNPSQYDGWTADMECPVTTKDISYREQVTNTVFNCRPEFLPAMSKYFTVLNLANNHTYDMGSDRFAETQKHIEDAGIQHLGNFDPGVKKDVCEVMAMKVHLNKSDGSSSTGSLPIAFCAWQYFSRSPYPGEFDVMKEYAKIMPVFGLMQVGVEYVPKAGTDQETIGRQIIDGGAEFVIGNSPHWVQNSDAYKGKLLFYSTGNFIFDQLDSETNRGASIEVSMKLPYDTNLAKWLALGESCKAQQDDCLKKATEQKLTKYKPELSFGLVASTTGYKQITKKANASVQSAVEERANWLKTLKGIGQQQ